MRASHDMCNTLVDKLHLTIRRAQEAEEQCDGLHVRLTEAKVRAMEVNHHATKAEAAQKLVKDGFARTFDETHIPGFGASSTPQLLEGTK